MDKETIIAAYRQYILDHGERPASVYQFARQLEIEESAFYTHFANFEAIEKAYWRHLVDRTVEKITAEEVYATYSAREKLLHFYFTLFEDLQDERSFLLALVPQEQQWSKWATGRAMSAAVRPYLEQLIEEGTGSGEVEQRPLVAGRYGKLLSLQWPLLVAFWLRDDSKGFEKTDSAIEKSVHASFDLIGRNALDSILDLGKFMYQNGMRL